jgi:hypothetical protein
MSGNNIISKTHAPRNGRTLAEAFEQAFIPQSNNRILIQTTRDFALSLTGLVVGKGSTGRIVEMQHNGQSLLVDFGLAGCVVRFPVGSDLIEFVSEAVSDES